MRLAACFFGADVAAPAPRGGALPDFGTAAEPMEVALVVLGMCAINESIASEWIRSCREVATEPLARALNHHHFATRSMMRGSAGRTSLPRRSRRRCASPRAAGAPELIAVNVAEWKKPDPYLPVEGIPAFGHLAASDSDAAVDAAIRDVVLPGLARVGLR